jgi:hypothetical protein
MIDDQPECLSGSSPAGACRPALAKRFAAADTIFPEGLIPQPIRPPRKGHANVDEALSLERITRRPLKNRNDSAKRHLRSILIGIVSMVSSSIVERRGGFVQLTLASSD